MYLFDSQNNTSNVNESTPYRPTYYYEVHLSTADRTILSIAVLVLLVFAIAGNVATLVVSIKSKKIRPLFRTCLISLATSDLIVALVTALDYLTAFFSTFPQLWTLGPTMCQLMPFLKVIANLVNSVTLVGISLDRYLSIRHIIKHLWEPSSAYCYLMAALVWTTSAGIAIPTYTAYQHYPVYLIDTNDTSSSDAITMVAGYMCEAPKSVNARYYIFLFGILFFPMVIAFVWFNSFIALDIFKRLKHKPGLPSLPVKQRPDVSHAANKKKLKENNIKASGLIFPTDSASVCKEKNQENVYQTNRERRQSRMLLIVLLLMITFLILKLPEWIFLMFTFYSFNTSGSSVLLSFIFGIISMSSAVFNPLLYAFVTHTVRYLMDFYRCALKFCCLKCKNGARALSSIGLVSEASADAENKTEGQP